MSSGLSLQQDKEVFPPGFSPYDSKALLHPEQKNILETKGIIRKLTLSRRPVVDYSAGTFSVAKKFIRLLWRRFLSVIT